MDNGKSVLMQRLDDASIRNIPRKFAEEALKKAKQQVENPVPKKKWAIVSPTSGCLMLGES